MIDICESILINRHTFVIDTISYVLVFFIILIKLLLLLVHLVQPVPQQHLSLPLSKQGTLSTQYLLYFMLLPRSLSP